MFEDDQTHRFVPDLDLSPLVGQLADVAYLKLWVGSPGVGLGESFGRVPHDLAWLEARGLLAPTEASVLTPDAPRYTDTEVIAALTEAVLGELRANTTRGTIAFTIRAMKPKGGGSALQRQISCSCLQEAESDPTFQQTGNGASGIQAIDESAAPMGIRAVHSALGLLADAMSRSGAVVEGQMSRGYALQQQMLTSQLRVSDQTSAALEAERAESARLRLRMAELEAELIEGAGGRTNPLATLAKSLESEEIRTQGASLLSTLKEGIAAALGAGGVGALGGLVELAKALPPDLRKRATSPEFLKAMADSDTRQRFAELLTLIGVPDVVAQ